MFFFHFCSFSLFTLSLHWVKFFLVIFFSSSPFLRLKFSSKRILLFGNLTNKKSLFFLFLLGFQRLSNAIYYLRYGRKAFSKLLSLVFSFYFRLCMTSLFSFFSVATPEFKTLKLRIKSLLSFFLEITILFYSLSQLALFAFASMRSFYSCTPLSYLE